MNTLNTMLLIIHVTVIAFLLFDDHGEIKELIQQSCIVQESK